MAGGGNNNNAASPVVWDSVKWPDGSTYEGLSKGDKCHLRGVVSYASGDRYEGEFQDNHMDGYGVYVWSSGTIYRGEWKESRMHGCGVKLSKQGNSFKAEEGQFLGDEWVGDVMTCSVDQARVAAKEADTAALMARAFQKPTGQRQIRLPEAEVQPDPIPEKAFARRGWFGRKREADE